MPDRGCSGLANKHAPTFSVIMPSYNHERYVGEAIQSVLNQSYGDLELIVIDDCSSDDSVAVIKEFAAKDSRVRAFFHQNNQGISRTMNEAIGKARGKYVALFASDDLWVKDKLQIQKNILDRDENLIVWSDGIIIDESGRATGETFLQMHDAVSKKRSGYLFHELIRNNYICGCSLVVKRKNMAGIKYDTRLKYLNDYKVMVDLSYSYRFHFVATPLVYYRIHKDNTIFASKKAWQADGVMIRRIFLAEYGRSLNREQKALLYFDMGGLFWSLHEYEKAFPCIIASVFLGRGETLGRLVRSAGKRALQSYPCSRR